MIRPDGRKIAWPARAFPTREEAARLITRLGSPREVYDERDILVSCGRGS